VHTLNTSFADVERGVHIRHMSLRAASHTVIGYFPINALNAICLNSSRIKSAQSSGRRREQNYCRIAMVHRAVIFAIARHLVLCMLRRACIHVRSESALWSICRRQLSRFVFHGVLSYVTNLGSFCLPSRTGVGTYLRGARICLSRPTFW